MIQGPTKNNSEKAYREIFMDSSSSLKDFSMDRKKYYRRYLLGEHIEDKENAACTMGRIVETLLLEPEMFDKRFYLSGCASVPTGLMSNFVEALYSCTMEATNEKGEITKSFEEISRDAHARSGFKISYEQVIKKFAGSDDEIYYREILQVRQNDLSVITPLDVTMAEKIVEELKGNFVTSSIVGMVSSLNFDVHNQYQVEGYDIDGHLFKSMIDKCIVSHKNKTISIYDLKCTFSVEGFYDDYYLYRRAYIQAYLYYRAMLRLTEKGMVYEGYKVLPTMFIVCDSTGYYNPLVYTLTQEDLTDAYVGFEYRGRWYPGVKSLIEDLKWCLDQNTWNISRENYNNNGIVKLKK